MVPLLLLLILTVLIFGASAVVGFLRGVGQIILLSVIVVLGFILYEKYPYVVWSIGIVIALSLTWLLRELTLPVEKILQREERRQQREKERSAKQFRSRFNSVSWRCENCGARIDPQVDRCPSCNTKLPGTSAERLKQATEGS